MLAHRTGQALLSVMCDLLPFSSLKAFKLFKLTQLCLIHTHTHTLRDPIYTTPLHLRHKFLLTTLKGYDVVHAHVYLLENDTAPAIVCYCQGIQMAKMFLVRCLFFPNKLWLKFLTFSLGKCTCQVYCFTLKAQKYLWKQMTCFWRRLYNPRLLQ